MAYAIKRTFEIDPPLSISADTVKALQGGLASSVGRAGSLCRRGLQRRSLVGLRVEMTVETRGKAGAVAHRAIREAGQSAGLPERSFRVTSGWGREV